MTKCHQWSLPLLLFTVYISHSHMKEHKAATNGYQLGFPELSVCTMAGPQNIPIYVCGPMGTLLSPEGDQSQCQIGHYWPFWPV